MTLSINSYRLIGSISVLSVLGLSLSCTLLHDVMINPIGNVHIPRVEEKSTYGMAFKPYLVKNEFYEKKSHFKKWNVRIIVICSVFKDMFYGAHRKSFRKLWQERENIFFSMAPSLSGQFLSFFFSTQEKIVLS